MFQTKVVKNIKTHIVESFLR